MRFALCLLALPTAVFADNFTVTSAPSAVTVYPGIAMVSRTVTVDVPQGTHELILPDLPQWVDARSLRISLKGATLAGTRLRNDFVPPQPDTDSAAVTTAKDAITAAEQALAGLDDDIAAVQVVAQAAEAQLTFLMGLSGSQTLPSEPAGLRDIAAMIRDETLTGRQAMLSAQQKARGLEINRPLLTKALKDAHAALAALTPPPDMHALLALSVEAETAASLTATISYPVQAYWQPTYDLFLTRGDDPAIEMKRSALISQNSSENWDAVTLTLFTLAPTGQITPSILFPHLVRYEDPLKPKAVSRLQSDDAKMAFAPSPVLMEASATARFDGPGVTYAVARPVTVASGADEVRVALDALNFEPRVFAQAVPARDSTAFLMAEGVNGTQEPLLRADVARFYVDGALVGTGPFAETPAGEDMALAFGPIEALRLTRTVLDLNQGDRGIISRSNAQTQTVRIDVMNLSDEAWAVELLDSVPYTEQEDLTIDWEATPAPDQSDVDDQRGILQWNLNIAPGAEQQITVEQDIRWPDGKVLR
ncbi:hypothetical protein C1J03_01755 [Sulfitobacter sp. SK012]|uniref:DUF4139 domain-containing protein n=1 Tax=Sulfitobacter sp. SK012 TaxID=1389005 RepID=UPI000E0AC38C|nr:DUF4139 domain-containing protein [Sulfitobacter sp. SK012]AXI44870.1 hypothetical protein C1J03_01755 [Sulfitobacter sp. SK012]